MTAVSSGSASDHHSVLCGLLRCLHPAVLLGLPALLPGLLPLLQLQAHCARAPALQWVQPGARWEGESAGQHVGGQAKAARLPPNSLGVNVNWAHARSPWTSGWAGPSWAGQTVSHVS